LSINLANLEASSQSLVKAALKAGADQCDVSVANGHSASVSCRDGKIENTGRSEGDSFSLRVFVGKKVASVSTNQIADLDMLAERAVAMAKVSPEDPFQGLAGPDEIAKTIPTLEMFDNTTPTNEWLRDFAMEAESAGLGVSGVAKSMGTSAGWGTSGFVLATSNGFSGSFIRSGFSCSAMMVSGEGEAMERDYDFTSTVFLEDLRSAGEIGKTAGERAVKRANPQQVKSGSFPVLFDRRQTGSFLGAIMGAINGSSIARKTSFLRDMMGKQIAAANIQVFDDPLRKRGLGSRPFDGEGMPCEAITFVKDGILQEWILDGATARELGLKSNGRASRSGAGTSPTSTNTWIPNGEKSVVELAKDIGTGFYCTETIGHGLNMVTGVYSKGASGFWIENGEIAYPVAGITIAGNLKDMFMSMIVANDLEFRGSTNAPSILMESMTIGGK